MDNELRYPLTDLTAGSMLRVCDGKGRAIVVFEGQVWITQDADQRDFVLGRGLGLRFPGLGHAGDDLADRPVALAVDADTELLLDAFFPGRRHQLPNLRVDHAVDLPVEIRRAGEGRRNAAAQKSPGDSGNR